MNNSHPDSTDQLPKLSRDTSFWGMTATQFLGAFNDNLFKQVALLVCVDVARLHRVVDMQDWALGLFALPFVLLSGYAGYLSDRISKRRIVIVCKLAEIVIVLLGTAAVVAQQFPLVLAVVFLMGTHSAFFGPAKYGILPEIVRERDLSAANGIFLMTTFLAIILGTAAAGFVKAPLWAGAWWYGSAFVIIALSGTATALLVRRTPVAHPGLPFRISSLALSGETVQLLRNDRQLLMALLMYSMFWLIAGIVHPTVNALGKFQLLQDDATTSLMVTSLSLGIAGGCALAGKLSGKRVNFRLVPWGAWGIVVMLLLLFGLGWLPLPNHSLTILASALLVVVGVATGLFTVPLQVFLQGRPPADQKGRVIGAMNLLNWIGILMSAGLYGVFNSVVNRWQLAHSSLFAATALLMLPVALFYHPQSESHDTAPHATRP